MTFSELNILVMNYKLKENHIAEITSAFPNARVTLCDFENAADYIKDTDILAFWSLKPIDELIAQAPRLKWIHAVSSGIECIDCQKLQGSEIIITNSKGIASIPIAEHVLALILSFSRGIPVYTRQQREHIWQKNPADEIYEKTIGIIGLGNIGRAVAERAKALGMRVLAVNRRQSEELFVDKMYSAERENLLEIFQQSDFVVICLPVTEATDKLIDASLFKVMKPSAYFINISRGAVVNEEHLIDALQNKRLQGAGLDVFTQEPLNKDNPLWDMPNVIITPHISSASPLYTSRAIKLFLNNLTRYFDGGQMINLVDKATGY